jgi:glucose/arabinose dehydrogenase
VWCGALPSTANDLVVVEHHTAGIWRLIRDGKQPRKELFADLSAETYISANQGLLFIAFHPDYASNRRYFLKHEIEEGGEVKSIIVERRASSDGLRDSGEKSRRLLETFQPAFNHNGGCLAFGPDGMLYTAFGDGGPQLDPHGYSQNPRDFLGSMLRIDVDQTDTGRAYAIPKDNPFLDAFARDPAIRPETWAIGFREPWRFSFDAKTGELYVGDVGQDKFEEVSLVRRGENHGWNVREAFAPFSDEYRRSGETYTDPILAYEHGLGFSVTGGYVYRGKLNASFNGVYIFGDYSTRRVWGLRQQDGVVTKVMEIGTAPASIVSFGVDQANEIYLVTYMGTIFHVDLLGTSFP